MSSNLEPCKEILMARGDLYEVDHSTFSHWAVDVGDGWVVENARANGGCVDYRDVEDLVRGRKFKVLRVSDDPVRREAIAGWAESQVGLCEYDLFLNNCESFVREAATGVRRSKQVESVFTLALVGVGLYVLLRGFGIGRA